MGKILTPKTATGLAVPFIIIVFILFCWICWFLLRSYWEKRKFTLSGQEKRHSEQIFDNEVPNNTERDFVSMTPLDRQEVDSFYGPRSGVLGNEESGFNSPDASLQPTTSAIETTHANLKIAKTDINNEITTLISTQPRPDPINPQPS